MRTIKLSFLLLFGLLFSNCKKEPAPLVLKGFVIKSITIKSIPLEKEGNCWDELDCDTPDGNPDIYLKLEQNNTFSEDLTFFTSEVFENYSNKEEIIITIPDRVFSLDFYYSFNLYDKDGLDSEADDKFIEDIFFVPMTYITREEALPTTIQHVYNDANFVVALEYVYE